MSGLECLLKVVELELTKTLCDMKKNSITGMEQLKCFDFRDNMKASTAFLLGLMLKSVTCLPKDVVKASQKTEVELLSREPRSAFAKKL